MSTKMVEAKLNGQWEIILPEHRAERPEWYTEKGWEKERLQALHDEIAKQISSSIQPVVYYVGSEESEMSALCQIWGAQLVMFEPNPSVWPNARAIWEANNLETPVGIYVGFASSVTDDDPPHRAHGAVGAAPSGTWPECAYGEVIGNHGFKELYQESDAFPQIRIDDYVDQMGIIPTIITFDCEGSGFEVLKGAEDAIMAYKPAIFASWHPEFKFHQYGIYLNDVRNWLKDKGYSEKLLAYDHEVHMVYLPLESHNG